MAVFLFVVLPFGLLFLLLKFVIWPNTPDWKNIEPATRPEPEFTNSEILDIEATKTRKKS